MLHLLLKPEAALGYSSRNLNRHTVRKNQCYYTYHGGDLPQNEKNPHPTPFGA